ncbi:MAG: ABC transporter permease [Marmoricola sp.]
MTAPAGERPLVAPGQGVGLIDVFRRRYLLTLLTRKELRVRYRGSILGLFWSYVKPAFQLIVFYIAMGKFLGLDKSKPDYLIYLFSGIVMINFFTEVFSNATRSVVRNGDLVKKIYLPRELFPVSSVTVAIVHLLPQVVILVLVALLYGWEPGPLNILAGLLAILVIMVAGLGLGLMFAAWNVLYRDAENFVDLVQMAATWMCPVLYTWDKVAGVLHGFWWALYQANPLTGAVELAHYAFWLPSGDVRKQFPYATGLMPTHFGTYAIVAVVGSAVVLGLGQLVFRRLEGRFAQEV